MSTTTYNASGTWSNPDAVDVVDVNVWGGGGGGGGGYYFAKYAWQYGGGGGGGGAYSFKNVTGLGGASQTVTVGTGGPGGPYNTSGTAGGDSWFKSTADVLAKGGGSGNPGVGGAAASGVGTVKYSGGTGGTSGIGVLGGGGGGSAGHASNGGNASGTTGGTAGTGTPPGAEGGAGATSSSYAAAGSAPGGGGGGGFSDGSYTAGYAGAAGRVTITWTPSITVTALSPTDGATGVAVGANLAVTFTGNWSVGSGNIVVYDDTNHTYDQTFAVGNAAITGTGTDTLTINPADMQAGHAYHVEIASTAAVGYAGIADATTWNFVTAVATQSISVGVASETEAAKAITVTAVRSVAVGAVAETESAVTVAAVPGPVSIAASVATETEAAQSITPVAGPVSITAATAAETETAEPITVSTVISIAVGVVSETETANAIEVVTGQIVTVGTASETEAAQAIIVVPGAISISVDTASETETAQPVVVVVSITVGVADETETALPVEPEPGESTIAVGMVTETEAADSVIPVPGGTSITVGTVTEVESGQPIELLATIIIVVDTATETETAQAVIVVSGGTSILVATATETESADSIVAVPGGISIAVGQVTETETARGIIAIAGQFIVVSVAIETESANPIIATPGGVSIAVGKVTEVETAGAVAIIGPTFLPEFTDVVTPILSIGRVGLDVILSDPREIHHGARGIADSRQETLSISGQLHSTTLAQANALRDELLAQVGQVVPITYTLDPRLDGFYFLDSANIDISRSYDPYTNFLFPFTISLTKINDLAFDIGLSGGLLPNAHSITTSPNQGFVGVGSVDFVMVLSEPSGDTSATLLPSRDGSVLAYYALDPTDVGPRVMVTPQGYYAGGCAVWVDSRIRAGTKTMHDSPSTVSILNGLAGIVLESTQMQVLHYDTNQWVKKYYQLVAPGTSNLNGEWTEVRVLRNDPDTVIVQAIKARETDNTGYLALTMQVRRGWRVILCQLTCDTADTLGIERLETEAASTLGSSVGIVATSPDSAGNKFIAITPDAVTVTNPTTTAGIRLTGADTELTFGLGMVVNSATPDTGADTQDLIDQTFNYVESNAIPVGAY